MSPTPTGSRPMHGRPPPTTARGFILVATLWTLAALAVVAGYVANVVESDVERAIATRHALQDELDRRSTEATLLYLLATTRMSHRGAILETPQRFTARARPRHPRAETVNSPWAASRTPGSAARVSHCRKRTVSPR